MKKLFYFLLCLISVQQVFAQNNKWFTDITISAGLQGLNTTYVQSADINGDNYPDLLVGTSGIISGHSNTFYLYLNVPDESSVNKRKFVDFTTESGLNVSRIQGKPMREYDIAVIGDVDNDGDVDVVTTMYYHRLEYISNPDVMDKSEVFLNDGTGHFTIKADAGLVDHVFYPNLAPGLIDGVGLAFIDYNYDGILDLYIATKFKDYARNITFPDILMKGNGDGSFAEVTDAGVADIVEPLYGVNVTDFDNDGWQDVITSPYCRSGGRIMKNLGDGSFIDIAQNVNYSAQNVGGDWYYDTDNQWKQQPLCQWEAPIADFDNDGDMDILQCLVHGGYESRDGLIEGHTHIAVNQGAPDYNFIDEWDIIHRIATPSTHLGDYGGLWVDFDNNGWQDLVITQGYYTPATDRAYMCIQRDDQQFYDVTSELGLMYMKDASNAQACDFDLDGDNDIFIFHNSPDGSKLRLIRNDISNQSNWVSMKLIPPSECNKDAVGARVRLYTDTIAQIREIQTGLGHFGGQEPLILNFGIGEINGIDSIEVTWPMKNSPVTKVYNPAWNTHLVINSEGFKEYLDLLDKPYSILKFSNSRTDYGRVGFGGWFYKEIELVNDGNSELTIKSLQISNSINFSFVNADDDKGFNLAPKETKKIEIKFTPTLREVFRGKLIVETGGHQADTAANGRIIAHDLIGIGLKDEALIQVNSKSFAFDSTKTFQELPLQITNRGELDLIVNTISISDTNNVFEIKELIDSQFLPKTLKSAEYFGMTVRFTPKARENYIANITINSNAYKDTNLIINLSGIGDAPTPLAKFDKVFINYTNTPVGKYADQLINIENTGDGTLNILSANIEENDDNVYTFVGTEFPAQIEPGKSKDLTLRFEPKEQKTYNRKVYIASDAFNEPNKTLNARAKGVAPEFVEQKIISDDLDLFLMPNPVIDKLKLVLNPKIAISNLEISVYGLNGELINQIYNGTFPNNNTINYYAKHLTAGTYIIVINYGKQKVSLPFTKINSEL